MDVSSELQATAALPKSKGLRYTEDGDGETDWAPKPLWTFRGKKGKSLVHAGRRIRSTRCPSRIIVTIPTELHSEFSATKVTALCSLPGCDTVTSSSLMWGATQTLDSFTLSPIHYLPQSPINNFPYTDSHNLPVSHKNPPIAPHKISPIHSLLSHGRTAQYGSINAGFARNSAQHMWTGLEQGPVNTGTCIRFNRRQESGREVTDRAPCSP